MVCIGCGQTFKNRKPYSMVDPGSPLLNFLRPVYNCHGITNMYLCFECWMISNQRLAEYDPVEDIKLSDAMVCRACLAMDVRLYDMRKHNLRAMYERVASVRIKENDKLPQMLCWECVGRVLSAKSFIDKALRTQRIFKYRKCLTMRHMKSINRSKNNLQSTLSTKVYKVNEWDLHIIEGTIDDNYINESCDGEDCETVSIICKQDISTEYNELNLEQETFSDKNEENIKFELEPFDISEVPEATNFEIVRDTDDIEDDVNCEEVDVERGNCEVEQRREESKIVIEKEIPTPNTSISLRDKIVFEDDIDSTIIKSENDDKMTINDIIKTCMFICDICNMSYCHKSTLIRHIQSHAPKFSCAYCSYKTNNETHLKSHSNSKHTEVVAYKYKAFEKITLDGHMQTRGTPRILNASNCIPMRDKKSINIKENNLTTTIGPKIYKVNETDLHIIEDAVDNNCINESCGENDCEAKVCNQENLPEYELKLKQETFNDSYEGNIKIEPLDINEAPEAARFVRVQDTDYIEDDVDCKEVDMEGENSEVEQRCEEYKIDIKEEILNPNTSINLRDKIIFENDMESTTRSENKDISINYSSKGLTSGSNGLFICDICNKSYRNKSSIMRHIQNHAPKFNCAYCNYKTNNEGHLKRHSNAKHTKIIAYKCSLCDYNAYDKSYLDGHMQAIHLKRARYFCPNCKYKTYHKTNLRNHINSRHTHGKQMEEHIDGIEINVREKDLIKHTSPALREDNTLEEDTNMENNKIEAKQFICDTCNTCFRNKSVLIRHIKTHASKLSCAHCNYKTNFEGNLNRHINAKHTKKITYKCKLCPFEPYDANTLDCHMQGVHLKETEYICPTCQFKTYHRSNLEKHINSQHTHSRTYKCSYCKFTAHQKSHLKAHINAIHTKTVTFECSQCDYKSYNKNNLRKHINWKHSKKNVFKCPHCNYEAFQRAHIRRHVVAKHTSVTRNCSYCDFTTKSKVRISFHLKTHHGILRASGKI